MNYSTLNSGSNIADPFAILTSHTAYKHIATANSNQDSKTIIDPLQTDQASNSAFTSVSAMVNDNPSVCPKCKSDMTTASIARTSNQYNQANQQNNTGLSLSHENSEQVFFCEKCRVTHPMKDVIV